MSEPMTIERLSHQLDAYGGELARWPAETRGAAQALLAASAEARKLLADARRLDEALAAVRPPRASATVARRVLTRPLAGFALAASLLLGVALGALLAANETAAPSAGGTLADLAVGAPGAETTVVIGLVDAEPWPYDTRVALTLY
jgi:hypothetical protein